LGEAAAGATTAGHVLVECVRIVGSGSHSRGQQKRFGLVCGGARMEKLEGEI